MKPILEKLLVTMFIVLKQIWLTILLKVEVEYQCANSPFMFLTAVTGITVRGSIFNVFVKLSSKSNSHLE